MIVDFDDLIRTGPNTESICHFQELKHLCMHHGMYNFDTWSYAPNGIAQFSKPELEALFDSTEDVLKLYTQGIPLPLKVY